MAFASLNSSEKPLKQINQSVNLKATTSSPIKVGWWGTSPSGITTRQLVAVRKFLIPSNIPRLLDLIRAAECSSGNDSGIHGCNNNYFNFRQVSLLWPFLPVFHALPLYPPPPPTDSSACTLDRKRAPAQRRAIGSAPARGRCHRVGLLIGAAAAKAHAVRRTYAYGD